MTVYQNQLFITTFRIKIKYYMLSNLPTTVIPLALVNIDIFTPQKELQTIGLTLASIINGINTLYNFSKRNVKCAIVFLENMQI